MLLSFEYLLYSVREFITLIINVCTEMFTCQHEVFLFHSTFVNQHQTCFYYNL